RKETAHLQPSSFQQAAERLGAGCSRRQLPPSPSLHLHRNVGLSSPARIWPIAISTRFANLERGTVLRFGVSFRILRRPWRVPNSRFLKPDTTRSPPSFRLGAGRFSCRFLKRAKPSRPAVPVCSRRTASE